MLIIKITKQERMRNCGPVWPSGKALGWEELRPRRFDSASAVLSLQSLMFVYANSDFGPPQ